MVGMNQCAECLEFIHREKCKGCDKPFFACGCTLGYCEKCEEQFAMEEQLERGNSPYDLWKE
jgi:hypothetical protein